jgi:hypothetical protein
MHDREYWQRGRARWQDPHPVGLGLNAIGGEAGDEIITKKPKTVDPHGGINKKGELTRAKHGLLAMPSHLGWELTADPAEQALAPLDLFEQCGNRLACA